MSAPDLADLAGDLYTLEADLEAMANVVRSMIETTEDRNRLELDGDRLQMVLSLLELRRPQVGTWARRADERDIAEFSEHPVKREADHERDSLQPGRPQGATSKAKKTKPKITAAERRKLQQLESRKCWIGLGRCRVHRNAPQQPGDHLQTGNAKKDGASRFGATVDGPYDPLYESNGLRLTNRRPAATRGKLAS